MRSGSRVKHLSCLISLEAITTFVIFVFLLQASGCALMFHGTSDQISIQGESSDSLLFLEGNQIGKGMATANVQRGKQYTITARKNGCSDSSVKTGSKFDEISMLGFLIDFGLISILLVDNLSGALWKTEPTTYTVYSSCP
jgi:hypothetical protein